MSNQRRRHAQFCVRVSGLPDEIDNPCDCGAAEINELRSALAEVLAAIDGDLVNLPAGRYDELLALAGADA